MLSSPAFDYAVDALIARRGRRRSRSSRRFDPVIDVRAAALSPVQATLTVVFALEVLAKGAVLPWREFWRRRRNRFDVAVTLATALVTLLVVLPNGFDNQAAIRAVLSLRLLRLEIRLLAHVRAFARTFATLLKASPAALKLLKTVGIHVFFFAVLGNQLFGGVITQDRSGAVITREQADALAASAFGQADYYANSFNDLLSGAVTLFELMVVNNWFVIVDGYSTVLGRPARLFFVLHYWLGVVVALNIIVAFVIDTYTSLESTSEAALDDDVLTFDAARVSGTDTGVSGEYEVSIAQLPFTPDDERGQLLAKLSPRGPSTSRGAAAIAGARMASLSDLLCEHFLVRGGGGAATSSLVLRLIRVSDGSYSLLTKLGRRTLDRVVDGERRDGERSQPLDANGSRGRRAGRRARRHGLRANPRSASESVTSSSARAAASEPMAYAPPRALRVSACCCCHSRRGARRLGSDSWRWRRAVDAQYLVAPSSLDCVSSSTAAHSGLPASISTTSAPRASAPAAVEHRCWDSRWAPPHSPRVYAAPVPHRLASAGGRRRAARRRRCLRHQRRRRGRHGRRRCRLQHRGGHKLTLRRRPHRRPRKRRRSSLQRRLRFGRTAAGDASSCCSSGLVATWTRRRSAAAPRRASSGGVRPVMAAAVGEQRQAASAAAAREASAEAAASVAWAAAAAVASAVERFGRRR